MSSLMCILNTSITEALSNSNSSELVNIMQNLKSCVSAIENIREADSHSTLDNEADINNNSDSKKNDMLRVNATMLNNYNDSLDSSNNNEAVLFKASSLPTLDFHVGNAFSLSRGNYGQYSIGFMKKTVERTPFKFFEMHVFYPKEPSTSTCFPSVAALHPVQVFHASFVSDWASYCRFWASHGMICFYSNERY